MKSLQENLELENTHQNGGLDESNNSDNISKVTNGSFRLLAASDFEDDDSDGVESGKENSPDTEMPPEQEVPPTEHTPSSPEKLPTKKVASSTLKDYFKSITKRSRFQDTETSRNDSDDASGVDDHNGASEESGESDDDNDENTKESIECTTDDLLAMSAEVIMNDNDFMEKIADANIRINWKLPELHTLHNEVRLPSALKRKQIKRKKLPFKEGHFSIQEYNIIKDNWDRLCKKYKIPNQPEVFGRWRNQHNVHRLRTARQKVVVFLSQGLPDRLPTQVYHKFVYSLGKTTRGRFSDEEKECIQMYLSHEYAAMFPLQFLASILGRDKHSLSRCVQLMKKENNLKIGNNKKKQKKRTMNDRASDSSDVQEDEDERNQSQKRKKGGDPKLAIPKTLSVIKTSKEIDYEEFSCEDEDELTNNKDGHNDTNESNTNKSDEGNEESAYNENDQRRESCSEKDAEEEEQNEEEKDETGRDKSAITRTISKVLTTKLFWDLPSAQTLLKNLVEVIRGKKIGKLKPAHLQVLRDRKVTCNQWIQATQKLGRSALQGKIFWNNRFYTQLYARTPVFLAHIRLKLIKILYDGKYKSWPDIKWDEVAAMFDSCTTMFLWNVFYFFAKSHSSPSDIADLRTVVTYLYKKYIIQKHELVNRRLKRIKIDNDGNLYYYDESEYYDKIDSENPQFYN